jgi:hypothetical protein
MRTRRSLGNQRVTTTRNINRNIICFNRVFQFDMCRIICIKLNINKWPLPADGDERK